MTNDRIKQTGFSRLLHWPLWIQILAAMMGAMSIAALAADWSQRSVATTYLKHMVAERNQQAVSLVTSVAIEALIVEDGPVLETIVSQSIASLPDIHAVIVRNEDGLQLAEWTSPDVVDHSHLLFFNDEFLFEGESFGSLEVVWDLSRQHAEIGEHVAQTRLLVIAVLFALTMGILAIMHFLVVRHVNKINGRILALAEGDLSTKVSVAASQELVRLADSVNSLAGAIRLQEQREAELRQHRDHLEELVQEQTADLLQSKEAAEAANEAKTDFLSNMSHELRTPMHAILSFSSMGEKNIETLSKEKLHRYFSRINMVGQQLLALINDLLDLSKLEAGGMEMDRQHNDLKLVVEAVVVEFGGLLDEKSLILDVVPTDTDADGLFDYDNLSQVVRNLLGNAIKFTPEGSKICVSFNAALMSTGRTDADMDAVPAVSVSVSDQGIGVPEDELETIFDKFAQSKKTNSGAGGTGLGLAICQEIIDSHGGRIYAENNPDVGATFTFIIPQGEMRERADESAALTG